MGTLQSVDLYRIPVYLILGFLNRAIGDAYCDHVGPLLGLSWFSCWKYFALSIPRPFHTGVIISSPSWWCCWKKTVLRLATEQVYVMACHGTFFKWYDWYHVDTSLAADGLVSRSIVSPICDMLLKLWWLASIWYKLLMATPCIAGSFDGDCHTVQHQALLVLRCTLCAEQFWWSSLQNGHATTQPGLFCYRLWKFPIFYHFLIYFHTSWVFMCASSYLQLKIVTILCFFHARSYL